MEKYRSWMNCGAGGDCGYDGCKDYSLGNSPYEVGGEYERA